MKKLISLIALINLISCIEKPEPVMINSSARQVCQSDSETFLYMLNHRPGNAEAFQFVKCNSIHDGYIVIYGVESSYFIAFDLTHYDTHDTWEEYIDRTQGTQSYLDNVHIENDGTIVYEGTMERNWPDYSYGYY